MTTPTTPTETLSIHFDALQNFIDHDTQPARYKLIESAQALIEYLKTPVTTRGTCPMCGSRTANYSTTPTSAGYILTVECQHPDCKHYEFSHECPDN